MPPTTQKTPASALVALRFPWYSYWSYCLKMWFSSWGRVPLALILHSMHRLRSCVQSMWVIARWSCSRVGICDFNN
jgi:hypothetical protein